MMGVRPYIGYGRLRLWVDLFLSLTRSHYGFFRYAFTFDSQVGCY